MQTVILGGLKASAALPDPLERNRIISAKQMAELLGFSLAHLRRLYRTGKIPRPLQIGGRKLGWPTSVAMALIAPDAEGMIS